MTHEEIEQERKAFEAWYYDSIGDIRFPLDKYENGYYCNPHRRRYVYSMVRREKPVYT